MKRVLVTGGAGFIGQHTVRLLEKKGYDVIALDYNRRKVQSMGCLHKIYGDIRNRPLLSALIAEYKPTGVIHLAAQSSVHISQMDWKMDADINALGTANLIDVCTHSSVKKIVFASSGGTVYGNPLRFPVREDAPLDPQSPYGITKLVGEFYVRISGVSHTILRYPNVYGPGQSSDGQAGVVAIFIGKMMNDEPCIIYGDGQHEKDYVYVEDVAWANILALESDVDGTFNIGSGEAVTVNTIHRLIATQMGTSIWPKYEAARLGDIQRFYLDASKARDQLGWKPSIGLEEGIKRTVEYMAQRGQGAKSPLSCGGGVGSTPTAAIYNN